MRSKLSALTATLVLSACGGGGSAGSSVFGGTPVNSTSYNVSAANHKLLTMSNTWSTTGTASGQTYTFSLTYQPLVAGAFSLTGVSGSRTQESLTFSSSQGSGTATTILYSNPANDALLGQFNATNGTCVSISGNTALPTAVNVGSSGPLYADSALSSCDSTGVATQTDTVTWSLETDNGVVLFCQNDTTTNAVGSNIPGTLNVCVEIGADGTPNTRARISVNIPGLPLSLVTRNY